MKSFHHLMYIDMHVCMRVERRYLNKILTVHWQHVARSLHVILCTTTLCPGAREQTGVAHIPWIMRFILVERLSYVQTSKTVFLASSIIILVKYTPWLLNRKRSRHALLKIPKVRSWKSQKWCFCVRTSSGVFPQHNWASICFSGF